VRDCSKTCGTGERVYIRKCFNGEIGEDECDGGSSRNESCNTQPCRTLKTNIYLEFRNNFQQHGVNGSNLVSVAKPVGMVILRLRDLVSMGT